MANVAPISNASAQGGSYDTSAPASSSYPQGGSGSYPDSDRYSQDQSGDYDNYDQPVEYATQAPPPLPEYDQPPCPGDDYIWTPGYWNYSSEGYYWVPGAWVNAPYQGALWTPGYWGYDRGRYGWHRGYWGRHVGYYGGINYGFGYVGYGYQGGYWQGDHFDYNRTVNNVNTTTVRNVYNYRVVNNTTNVNRVSYNGPGGIQVRPRPAEMVAVREQHTPPMTAQVQQVQAAKSDRANFASANQGRPQNVAVARPLPADHNIRPPAPVPMNRPGTVSNTRPGEPASQPQPRVNEPSRPNQPAANQPGLRPQPAPRQQEPTPQQRQHPAPVQRPERQQPAPERQVPQQHAQPAPERQQPAPRPRTQEQRPAPVQPQQQQHPAPVPRPERQQPAPERQAPQQHAQPAPERQAPTPQPRMQEQRPAPVQHPQTQPAERPAPQQHAAPATKPEPQRKSEPKPKQPEKEKPPRSSYRPDRAALFRIIRSKAAQRACCRSVRVNPSPGAGDLRLSVSGLHFDGDDAADPANRATLAGYNEFDGAVVGERFSIDAVGQQHGSVVYIG